MCVILSIVIVDYIQTLSNIVQIFLLKGEYLEKCTNEVNIVRRI